MYWTDQWLENYQYGEKNISGGQEAKEWGKKICLLFQSVFLNFSNEEYIYLLIQIVCEIIRIAFGC